MEKKKDEEGRKKEMKRNRVEKKEGRKVCMRAEGSKAQLGNSSSCGQENKCQQRAQ